MSRSDKYSFKCSSFSFEILFLHFTFKSHWNLVVFFSWFQGLFLFLALQCSGLPYPSLSVCESLTSQFVPSVTLPDVTLGLISPSLAARLLAFSTHNLKGYEIVSVYSRPIGM